MKQIFTYYFLLILLFSSCDKKLDVTLDYNPFDPDYSGPDIIFIDSIIPKYLFYINLSGDTVFYNRFANIYVSKTYECIDSVCTCTIIKDGAILAYPAYFIGNKSTRSIPIIYKGTYIFEVALNDGGGYLSKLSQKASVTFAH